jgi:hypothetical protein
LAPSSRKSEHKEEKILSSFQSLALKFGKPKPWSFELWRTKKKRLLALRTLAPKFGTPREFFLSTLPSSWLSYGRLRKKVFLVLQTSTLKFRLSKACCFQPSQAWS